MACELPVSVTPEPIHNRPSLSAIRYRIGTYASFRRAMLEALSRAERRSEPGAGPTRPLRNWTSRESHDFGIAFLDMWAYLGDVLTFYQERIANEAYLRTGVQPPSTTHLVSLIGYRPGPGRAATAWLAFETDEDATVTLPGGLRIQSVPGEGEKPQKFETLEALEAHGALNVLRPRTTEPQTLGPGARRAGLAGLGHGLREGDWIAIVGEELRQDPRNERWDVRRLASVAEDEEAGTTTVTWERGLGATARPWRGAVLPASQPEVWVFRQRAWLFGYNAPDYRLIELGLDAARAAEFTGQFPNWNAKHLPEDTDHPEHIYLDSVYPGVVADGWVALVKDYIELYRILEVADTTRLGYTLSARVTRLTVPIPEGEESPEHIENFPIRGTVALIGSERIPMADVPLGHSAVDPAADAPVPVSGDGIELDGHYPELRRGRVLLVAGRRVDPGGGESGESSEAVEVSSVVHDPEGRTTVRLTSRLVGYYERSSVRIYGNVAPASHGESVHEVLGSGDASLPFQSFTLKKKPVTHVPQAGAPGGVASTLEVRVDGVRWQERQELHGEEGDARVWVARRTHDQTTRVQTGDGVTGALLPSGRNNVDADYRVGLGPEGNVGAGSLRTLLQKPLGLRAVTNPAAAAGGTAPEDPADVKEAAPGTVRTFGRIVSLRDFEDVAREYVGVAKARGTWRWDAEQRVVDLVVAGEGGAPVASILSDLQADLDARRDHHRLLRIREFTRMPVSVRLALVVDDAYLLEEVREAADVALRALFAFDALDLGQTVHLSDVHEAVQGVDGVVAVDVDEFRFKRPEDRAERGREAVVQPRLLIGPGELAWVEAPDDLEIAGARFEGREGS